MSALGDTMSKHILIISASPRANSNSDTMADAFMEGALAAGHVVENKRSSGYVQFPARSDLYHARAVRLLAEFCF